VGAARKRRVTGIGLLLSSHGTLIVGVEDDPGGLAIRVFVGHRASGRYYLVSEPWAKEKIWSAWRSTSRHLVADLDELAALGPLLTERRTA
jgi:hypothetical protein